MKETPETLINTPIIDLRITGKHAAIPHWLEEEASVTDFLIDALRYAFYGFVVEDDDGEEGGGNNEQRTV